MALNVWNKFTEAHLFEKLNIIANIFTILGVSIATILAKPFLEKFTGSTFQFGNFFYGLTFILFGIVIFLALWFCFFYAKKYFKMMNYGLFIYYGLQVVYWSFGLALFCSLGFEMIELMLR